MYICKFKLQQWMNLTNTSEKEAIAAEAAAAAAAKQQMATSWCQNSDVYKCFSAQLASARLMDKKMSSILI